MIIYGTTSHPVRTAGLVMAKKHKSLPPMQFSYPLPYGAILREDGVQFVVFSRHATEMKCQ